MPQTSSITRFLLLALLLTTLSACGGEKDGQVKDGPDPFDGSRDVNVRARLSRLFQLVKEDNRTEAAELIVYRGEDQARNWKARCDYTKEDDKKHVDIMFKKLAFVLAAGEPTYVKFSKEKESEGTWLIWEVTFGQGDTSKTARLASLEIDGFSSLGDTDIRLPR